MSQYESRKRQEEETQRQKIEPESIPAQQLTPQTTPIALLENSTYTTAVIELILDHIGENLDGADETYLNNIDAQKGWLQSTGKKRGLNGEEIKAAYVATRDKASISKFTKNHPSTGKAPAK